MKLDVTSYTLNANECFMNETKKDGVVLHFTAGPTAIPAIQSFKNGARINGYPVSTAYVVDADGAVYRLFEDKYWSYHLGIKGPAAQNHKHDKRTIGIEIANVGPLRVKGDSLYYWPPANTQTGQPTFKSLYCKVSDKSKYVKLPKAFRGESYYASFTQEQAVAVAELVNDICERHSIPKEIPPDSYRHVFDMSVFGEFSGVMSHVNFRPDKYDLAPGQADNIYHNLASYGFSTALL